LDQHALDALAGNVRQLMLIDEGHRGVLRLRRIREDAAERQSGEKQRTDNAFHSAPHPSGGGAGSGRCRRPGIRSTVVNHAPRRGSAKLYLRETHGFVVLLVVSTDGLPRAALRRKSEPPLL